MRLFPCFHIHRASKCPNLPQPAQPSEPKQKSRSFWGHRTIQRPPSETVSKKLHSSFVKQSQNAMNVFHVNNNINITINIPSYIVPKDRVPLREKITPSPQKVVIPPAIPLPASLEVEPPKPAPIVVELPKPAPIVAEPPKPAPVIVEPPKPAPVEPPKQVVKSTRILAANDRLEGLMEDLEKGLSKFDSPINKLNALKGLIKSAAFLRKQEPATNDEITIEAYALAADALDRELRNRFADLTKPPQVQIVEVPKTPKLILPVPPVPVIPQVIVPKEEPKPPVEPPVIVKEPVRIVAAPPIAELPVFDAIGPKTETIDLLLKVRSNWIYEFTDLVRQEPAIEKVHSDLRDVRADFWRSLEKKCLSCDNLKDFDALKKEIAFQQEIDARLLKILKNETALAHSKKSAIRGNLAILKDCIDNCIKQSPTPVDLEVLLALEIAEKKNNHRFLNELKGMKTFFAKHDYKSLATHYDCTIAEFDEIEKQLDGVTDINKYVADWNALLADFEPQHRLFLKLKAAEQDFESCGNEIGAMLYQLDAKNDDRNFEVIANFVFTAPDSTQRANLKTSEEIVAFIGKLESFTNEVRIAINTLRK